MVTADLVIHSGTTLTGSGRGSSIIKRQSTTSTVAVIKNSDQTTYTDTDISICDLTVWRAGEATTANTPLDNTIQLVGVTRASVLNCRVRGGAKAIHMYGCVDWNVSGNYVDTFVDNAIAANPSPTSTNTTGYGRISGNYCSTPTASGFSLGSSTILCFQSAVNIENNVVQDASGNAIEIAYNAAVVAYVNVIGNLLKWSGAANINNNILFTDRTADILVEGNTLQSGSIYFSVASTADYNDRVTVKGNKVNTGRIQLNNCRSFTVEGNTVYGYTGRGLIVSSCLDGTVANNSVSSCTLSGYWVVINGAAADTARILFRNNVAFNNGTAGTPGDTYGFFINGGDKIQLAGNRAYDSAGASGTQTHGLYINATTGYVDHDNDFTGNKTGARAAFTSSPTQRGVSGDVLDHVTFTAGVNISATAEASATTIVTADAISVDGNTDVIVEFYSPRIDTAANIVALCLFDGSTSLGQLNNTGISSAAGDTTYAAQTCKYKLTPSSGSHTYSVRGFRSSGAGTPVVYGGAAGTGNFVPGYIRITVA